VSGSTCGSTEDRAVGGVWVHVRSAPLRGALLGLLLERPGHGGELARRARDRLGEGWRVARNDVYRLLERLESEGLARAVENPGDEAQARARVVYHPTSQTAPALGEWMEALTPRESIRLGIHAKLAVSREQDAPRLLLALRQYERECLALAQLIGAAERAPDSFTDLCLECQRDATGVILRAEISWAERTRARIEAHRAQPR
jgi:DNA-binding PadR family transcriptional regulator